MTHQTIKIGPCTVLHGNCLQALEDLPANFDALITDPPYSSGGRTAGERQKPPSEKYVQGGGLFLITDKWAAANPTKIVDAVAHRSTVIEPKLEHAH